MGYRNIALDHLRISIIRSICIWKQNTSYNTTPPKFTHTNVGQHVLQLTCPSVSRWGRLWYKPSASGVLNMGFKSQMCCHFWMICAEFYTLKVSERWTLVYWLIGFVLGNCTVMKNVWWQQERLRIQLFQPQGLVPHLQNIKK